MHKFLPTKEECDRWRRTPPTISTIKLGTLASDISTSSDSQHHSFLIGDLGAAFVEME
jgi:hypothetical protein